MSDCCASTLVPGGTFDRGYDVAADGAYADMTHPATLSDFRLDTYEVTVGRYRAFVDAGRGTMSCGPEVGAGAHPALPASGWQEPWNIWLYYDVSTQMEELKCDSQFATWTDSPGANENLPINCVSWYQAMAFCIADGGYLPTAAEWNYAASGGDEQRAYPWSQPADSVDIDCQHASYRRQSCDFLSAVGSKPAGNARWGQADMAGNLYEWNLDWDWYQGFTKLYVEPCVDCAKLDPEPDKMFKILRGGFFNANSQDLRTSVVTHATLNVTYANAGAGFRCARPVSGG